MQNRLIARISYSIIVSRLGADHLAAMQGWTNGNIFPPERFSTYVQTNKIAINCPNAIRPQSAGNAEKQAKKFAKCKKQKKQQTDK